jgi:hypothetical protein
MLSIIFSIILLIATYSLFKRVEVLERELRIMKEIKATTATMDGFNKSVGR